MSKNINRPEIGDFWDDCIKNDIPKKTKQSKQKSNSKENNNYNNDIFINTNNTNINQRNNNKFLKNHKLLKKILHTEESIPRNLKKNEEKQIEILISLYNKDITNKKRKQKELNNLREKKIKAELENCPFKPEKKCKRNKSYEETYEKNFGKKNIYERDKYYKNKFEKKIKEYKKEEKEGEIEENKLYLFRPKIEQKDINKVLYGNNIWEKFSNNFSNKIFLWRYMKARKDELDKKKRLIWSMDKNNKKNSDDENINDKRIITNNNKNKNIHRSISQKDSLLYKKTLHFSLLDFRTNHDEDNNNNEQNKDKNKNNNNGNIMIK